MHGGVHPGRQQGPDDERRLGRGDVAAVGGGPDRRAEPVVAQHLAGALGVDPPGHLGNARCALRHEAVGLFPDRDEYYEDPNKGQVVFTGDLSLRVDDHDFHLLHTPGHTPGQLAVYVPQERMVFPGDSVFCECQTRLMTSDVDEQRAALLSWKAAVAEAVAAGWTREETQGRVKFPKLGPVDVGQEYMLEYVETLDAGSLFDRFTARPAAPAPPRSS
ncbi:MBL fold metallo-hydrolase [Geodermatophilus sp. SYSU D00684]